jgi:hypothetical protein
MDNIYIYIYIWENIKMDNKEVECEDVTGFISLRVWSSGRPV